MTTVDVKEPPPPEEEPAAAAAGANLICRRRRSRRRRRSISPSRRRRSRCSRSFRRRAPVARSCRRRHRRRRRRRRPRGASPKNQRRWAGRIQDNYPSRALREGTEGTVGVAVDGRLRRPRDFVQRHGFERIERSRRSRVQRDGALCALRTGARRCRQSRPPGADSTRIDCTSSPASFNFSNFL